MSGDSSSRPWAKENTFGFLHEFCREEQELKKALDGVPCAVAVASRLKRVFAASRGIQQAYVIVKRPPRLTEGDALVLARKHLLSLVNMARELGNDEALQILSSVTQFQTTRAVRPKPQTDSPETMVYELELSWFREVCDDPFAGAMSEATYSLAADFMLAHFVLWPFARRRSEPYDAYFDLWRHGATLSWSGPSCVNVHLPPRA